MNFASDLPVPSTSTLCEPGCAVVSWEVGVYILPEIFHKTILISYKEVRIANLAIRKVNVTI